MMTPATMRQMTVMMAHTRQIDASLERVISGAGGLALGLGLCAGALGVTFQILSGLSMARPVPCLPQFEEFHRSQWHGFRRVGGNERPGRRMDPPKSPHDAEPDSPLQLLS
jgi:hypothetical protein